MVKLDYTFSGDAFMDGAGGDKFLIDISEQMSTLYGRLIRQGQIFRVRDISCRIVNPNTVAQDEVMAVSGKYVWYAPTKPRKEAWKNAFVATMDARKRIGFKTNTDGYDFRVGFAEGYSTDVGAFGVGVKMNAWLDEAGEPLMFTHSNDEQNIFTVYNSMMAHVQLPGQLSYSGFGSPYQKDTGALTDVLDFVTNDDTPYFTKGAASTEAQTHPFMVSFTSLYESAAGATEDANSVTTSDSSGYIGDVLCGLVGIYVDTTTIDDDMPQTQDWALNVSVDVQSWKPILKRRKSKRGRRKGKR